MKITPKMLDSLIGIGIPGEGQELAWVSEEIEEEAKAIISQALTQIPVDLQKIWVRRENGESFSSLAANRERARQLYAKAARRLRGKIVEADQVKFLHDSIYITYTPNGRFDPAWASIAQAAQITGLSADHLRYLARNQFVESQKIRGMVYLRKSSLKNWIESEPKRGKKRGQWLEKLRKE